MPTDPLNITYIPSRIIGLPFMVNIAANVVAPVGGIEFDDAVGIWVVSNEPFYFTFAENDIDATAQLNADATRGWRGAGSWSFTYYAESRKLYLKSINNGTILSFERLKAFSPVPQ